MRASIKVYCPIYRQDKSHLGFNTNNYVASGYWSPYGLRIFDVGRAIPRSSLDSLLGGRMEGDECGVPEIVIGVGMGA